MANIPDYSGYAGWGQVEAEADFRATGGRGKESGGGDGGGGGGTSSGVTIPPFSFNYQALENAILLNPNSELNKYYKQKLDEAGGDVTLAKKRIEEDYSQGKRYREEDLATQLAEEERIKQQEFRDTSADVNRRGILFGQIPLGEQTSRAPYSDVASRFFLNPLSEKQVARKQAIERAIQRQSEDVNLRGSEAWKKRGIEDIDIAYPRYQRGLEQEKLTKYRSEIVPYEAGKAAAKYCASFNPYMQGGW